MQSSQSSPNQQAVDLAYTGRSQRNMAPTNDGGYGPLRQDRTNEVMVENVWSDLHTLAVEGSLFIAATATPGTGITFTSATGTTYSDTQAIFGVNNIEPTPSLNGTGKDVIPLWLKIIITSAGTAGTDSHVASRLDKGARVSAGTALTGNCSSPSYTGGETSTLISVLPTVAAATAAVRNMGRGEVRKAGAPAYVVGDCITFLFGCIEQIQAQAITAAGASNIVVPLPGIIIAPGWSWVLNEWMSARSAVQAGEMEFGYCLR